MLNIRHHSKSYCGLEILLEFRQPLKAKLPREPFYIHPSISAWLWQELGIIICVNASFHYSCGLSPLPGLLGTVCSLLLFGSSKGKSLEGILKRNGQRNNF